MKSYKDSLRLVYSQYSDPYADLENSWSMCHVIRNVLETILDDSLEGFVKACRIVQNNSSYSQDKASIEKLQRIVLTRHGQNNIYDVIEKIEAF
jgi:hypothetical protein